MSYTGTGSNATVGHGLGVAPSLIINKCRSATQNWATYHAGIGATKAVFLDGTDAALLHLVILMTLPQQVRYLQLELQEIQIKVLKLIYPTVL